VYIDLHVRYFLFFSIFSRTWIFSADFRKYSNIKFNKNLSCGSPVIPCGQTDGQTETHDKDSSRFSPFC